MFNFLKKRDERPKFPEFPSLDNKGSEGLKFPEFPSKQSEEKKESGFPKFPDVKGTFLEDKHEEIPTYKPAFPIQENKEPLMVEMPKERPIIEPKEELEIPIRKPVFKPMIAVQPQYQPFKEVAYKEPRKEEKSESIFVKVEKYEEARGLINEIEERLKESEKLIGEMEKLKSDEELQLKEYQESINSIKQKLVEIDKVLFSE